MGKLVHGRLFGDDGDSLPLPASVFPSGYVEIPA
jgi:hypothetical protein